MDKQLEHCDSAVLHFGPLTDIVQVTITSLLPLEPLTMVWSRYVVLCYTKRTPWFAQQKKVRRKMV
jgi:hypothetical protein